MRIRIYHFILFLQYSYILEILVNVNATFQSIIGFGGAFTDAAGINIQSLSANTQRNLLASYYSTEGL